MDVTARARIHLLIPVIHSAATFLVGEAVDVHVLATTSTLIVLGAYVATALWHKVLRRGGVWENWGPPWWQTKFGWLKKSAH